MSCQKCGYALSRTSTYTTARKLHYYRCIGSDGWRKLGGSVCDSRPVRRIPTRKQSARWERSVIWAMLRNPAYRGAASFGKTRIAGRVRVTRARRHRGGLVSSDSVGHERPREEWIEIPVPALVSEEHFARAQELSAAE